MQRPQEYEIIISVQKRDNAQWGISHIFTSDLVKLWGILKTEDILFESIPGNNNIVNSVVSKVGVIKEEDAGNLLEVSRVWENKH